MEGAALARAHGLMNVAGGLWPLLHRRSFEAVFGRKDDWWLAQTVALLLVANGATQAAGAGTADGVRTARRLGIGTAAALAAIDLAYGLPRRIPRAYLADAAVELAWVAAWLRARTPAPS